MSWTPVIEWRWNVVDASHAVLYTFLPCQSFCEILAKESKGHWGRISESKQ